MGVRAGGSNRKAAKVHQSLTRGGKAFWGRAYPLDLLSWAAAITLAGLLRFDFNADLVPWTGLGRMMIAAALLQLLFACLLHAYRGRHPWGSFESVTDLLTVVILVGLTLWVVTLAFTSLSNVPIIASLLALMFMSGFRYAARVLYERAARASRAKSSSAPFLVYGAGYVGDHLTRLLTTDVNSDIRPVGFVVDDKVKAGLRHGVPVLGTFDDLEKVVAKARPEGIIVAIGAPSA